MIFSDRLETALERLAAALRQLEAAADRQAEVATGRADLQDEFQVLQDDRSRLALELDDALARSRSLLGANAEVLARLDKAGGTMQAVMTALSPDRLGARPSGHAEPPDPNPEG